MPDEQEYEAPLYAFHLAYKATNVATIFVAEDMMLAIMEFVERYGTEPDAVALIGQVDYIGRYATEPDGSEPVVLN